MPKVRSNTASNIMESPSEKISEDGKEIVQALREEFEKIKNDSTRELNKK